MAPLAPEFIPVSRARRRLAIFAVIIYLFSLTLTFVPDIGGIDFLFGMVLLVINELRPGHIFEFLIALSTLVGFVVLSLPMFVAFFTFNKQKCSPFVLSTSVILSLIPPLFVLFGILPFSLSTFHWWISNVFATSSLAINGDSFAGKIKFTLTTLVIIVFVASFLVYLNVFFYNPQELKGYCITRAICSLFILCLVCDLLDSVNGIQPSIPK